MKNALQFIFLGVLFLNLKACTWNSKRDLALEAAKGKLEAEFLEESKSLLEQKPNFHKKYVATMINKADFEVIKEEEDNKDELTMQIRAKIVPGTARQSLKEIFAKQNEGRETNLNSSEALALIYKEHKLKPESTADQIIIVKLKKKTDWEVVSVK